ncbi:uncharacterized protein LOC105203770 isoform X2 [Solenopsis invicta]|nr:uncharacterized protein LOC105203770 isoform X2 [Solenopsis invicta]XP_011170964.2 uncharacterized protein LOC105203770 isoform X2 [Solenopsis invicta]
MSDDGTISVVNVCTPNTVAVNTLQDEPMDFETKKLAMEKQLIDEVFRRPSLWNFKLPLVERSPQVKKKLWEEVFEAMGGTFSIDTLKRKWKSLSDSFRIHSKKEQAINGSAATATSRKKSWVHLERMKFLRDLQLQSKIINNIELELQDSRDSNSFEEASSLCDNSNSSIISCEFKKRRMAEDNLLNKITDSLNHPVSLNLGQINRLVSCPLNDKPALFSNLIAIQLREMDPELQDEVMLEIFKITTNAKKKKT